MHRTGVIFARALDLSPAEHIFAAWTGGKDSTVMLHQWMIFLQEQKPGATVRALSLDTGYKFVEVLDFRDEMARKWGIELKVIRPGHETRAEAVNSSRMECCRLLKIEPLQRAVQEYRVKVLLTGIRRDEHESRQQTSDVQERKEPDYFQVNPLAHWTEMDVWACIMMQGLPYCSLYDRGYRSLGCMPCTDKGTQEFERSGRHPEKEESMKLLRSMGYF